MRKDIALTYAELEEQSHHLAQYLRGQCQVQAHDFVGVMMDNSIWAVVSILGILKAGAAYVPIDKDLPIKRKQFIIQDTNLKALCIQSESLFDVIELEVPIISLDVQMADICESSYDLPIPAKRRAEEVAYVYLYLRQYWNA